MNEFLKEIKKYISDKNIYLDPLRRLAWGTDAGFYRLVPQIVIQSENEVDIACIVNSASKYNMPVTFRAAGTSLSGQAISDSILVIAGKNWEKYTIADDNKTIRLQPGIVGQRVNEILKPFGKKFPPDPASLKSAMVGGIVQNNASGMSCGTHENSYKMLVSVRLILADGTILDTGDAESKADFLKSHTHFIAKICSLRDAVKSDKELAAKIRRKYAIKNVTGLSINAFIDFDDPFQIITNLIVGSEGTLAFLAEATMKTVDDLPCKASAMLYFPTMYMACEAVIKLKNSPVTAVELFDRLAIRSVEDKPNAIPELKQLPKDGAVLLIKTDAVTPEKLRQHMDEISSVLTAFETLFPTRFTDKEEEYSAYWTMRSGIFPTVGSTRETGTTCIIEDVAFQLSDIPEATKDIRELLIKHNYSDAVIYGHALEGNFHFILNQRFDSESELNRYQNLMTEVVDLVVDKYDGSLKAEHGTGRNMAPFVCKEWGDDAFQIMKEVKQLFDPLNIFNPGVIFNDDPNCYLKNLKTLPETNPIIDKCIECGFCEINCVSSGLTLSARQRIVVQREIKRLSITNENPEFQESLQKSFVYAGDQTCAGDGLCATSCPVGINVGEYIHVIRQENISKIALNIGNFAANNFGTISKGLKSVLFIADATRSVFGNKAMGGITKSLRFISRNTMPLWTSELPKPSPSIPKTAKTDNPLKVVYFPSCLNQMMGISQNDPDKTPLVHKMVEFLNKAGYEVIFPEKMQVLCCGTIWESKGMPEIADRKADELYKQLLIASENGKYPVLCDQSPCLYRMHHTMQGLKLYEPVEFIHDFLLEKLDFLPTDEVITVFPTCSTRKMELDSMLVRIAKMCSTNVFVPQELVCCGFAGDKGFTIPELNEHGLRKLRQQLEKAGVKAGYSNSRTCEIGLNSHGGVPYMSIVYLVDKCTHPKANPGSSD